MLARAASFAKRPGLFSKPIEGTIASGTHKGCVFRDGQKEVKQAAAFWPPLGVILSSVSQDTLSDTSKVVGPVPQVRFPINFGK
ncbi:MAG: hypothetical protein C7B46_04285 [Sulfobacillus benefaciens]|uniref:Uncharacterized protein n=1 Tax=Sulfobacillus benefaciens TaxID=453960 RepID=A0A2T2XJI9_9FIRM|nr:MAG: hypothetical protein C7B46_04285 [Sulfobacillus benefaciens]